MKRRIIFYLIVFSFAGFSSSTVLGDLAASMKPGEWKELNTNSFGRSLLSSGSGGSTGILEYSSKAAWDAVSGKFMYLGSPHMNPYKFIVYTESTNSWSSSSPPFYAGLSHGYCYNSIDAANSRLLYWAEGRIRAYDAIQGSWNWQSSSTGLAKCCGAHSYFPDRGISIVLSNRGCATYNYANNQWSPLSVAAFNHHTMSIYNPIRKEVFFGGGNSTRTMYIMKTTGNPIRVADAPAPLRTCQSILTYDPAGGKYLAYYYGGSFYEYDSQTDRWRSLPSPPYQLLGSPCNGGIAAPINNHGVIMHVNAYPLGVYLYKHSENGTTGIEKTVEKSLLHITVSPNPFCSQTRIDLKMEDQVRIEDIRIYNMQGRLVEKISAANQSAIIWDSKRLPNGIYILKLKAGQQYWLKKLIIQ